MTHPTPENNSQASSEQHHKYSDVTAKIKANLGKRHAREKRFKFYGLLSISVSFAFLIIFLANIFSVGLPAFQQTYIKLDIHIDGEILGVDETSAQQEIFAAPFDQVIFATLKDMFPDAKDRKQRRARKQLVSSAAYYDLRDQVVADPTMIGTTQSIWVLAKDDVDVFFKGNIGRNLPEDERRVKDFQIAWIDSLVEQERIKKRFNTIFFTAGDSREPEQAGIAGALKGSLLTMLITIALSFPVGVLTAIYLEEFAPQNNRWIDIIEVNINNLAAVPSIVFGLLGLAVFIGFFGVPRSAPIVGGLVLTLMTLPTIIIASRASIKSVPPSIREAALGLGASNVQTTFNHVLPLAMPGILTGTIIGMAQALGETAPLLMIGMIAFVADIPQAITDPAAVMPVQIFLWSDSPERAFTERTSAAIIILLGFLVMMNLLAVLLRKRFERKW